MTVSTGLAGLVVLALAAPQGAATSEPSATAQGSALADIVLKVGGEHSLFSLPYTVGQIQVGDTSVCEAWHREATARVAAVGPGKTTVTLYDTARRARDRLTCHALGAEAWIMHDQLRGLPSSIEGLRIEIDGPHVVLRGSLLSQRDLARASAEAERSEWVVDRTGLDPFVLVVLYGPRARYRASYRMYDEPDWNEWHHGRQHLHALIAVEDLGVMVLRAEAGFPSIQDRARTIVRRLNDALLEIAKGRPGEFTLGGAGGTTVGFQQPGEVEQVIARVSGGDRVGYERRSLGYDAGSVTERMVGEWWRSLVSDAVDLYVRQQAPRSAVQVPEGDILLRLYYRAVASSEGEYDALSFKEEIAKTHPDERDLLEILGARVPMAPLRR